jgi:zinc D-Ala-D-Ala dipeptidase
MRRLLLVLALAVSSFAQQAPFFHIQPVRPVEQLRKEALSAEPPMQISADFLRPELVELVKLDATVKLDIRYASTNNFLSTPMYEEARAFLQKPAAEALVRANKELAAQGFGLMIHDGYRPWYVTKMFWDATPPDKHEFVADPAKGSNHNRGCAVDLTLYDLKTGKAVPMPSLYDEMSERSYPDYKGGTEEEMRNRATLRAAMEKQGFTVYKSEWWHFDYKDWQKYPVLNVEFAQIPDPNFPPNIHSGSREIIERNGHKLTTPQSLRIVPPKYSELAKRDGVQGEVLTWVFVGKDGRVKQVIVHHGPGGGLDENTIRALSDWTFLPAKDDGAPVPVMINVPQTFMFSH